MQIQFVTAQEEESDPLQRIVSSLSNAEVEHFKKFVGGNNRFGFNLFKQLERQPGSFGFSPCSIALGVNMPAVGAQGETLKQFQQVFGYSQPLSLFASDLEFKLQNPEALPGGQLSIANTLWIDKSIPILPSFKLGILRNFREKLDSVDFVNNLNAAIQKINQWVAAKTKGKINFIVTSQDINGTMRMVLTTAFYIQGGWEYPFDQKDSKRLPFKVSKQRTALSNMMHRQGEYLMVKGKEADLIAIPLANQAEGLQISFVIIMPPEKKEIIYFVQDFTYENWMKWKEQFKMTKAAVTIPSFQIDRRLNVMDGLQGMGLKAIFRAGADFMGISNSKGLVLNQVIHKSPMMIDERGLHMNDAFRTKQKGAQPSRKNEEIMEFLADRPFLFVVWEQKMDVILYMGRISIP